MDGQSKGAVKRGVGRLAVAGWLAAVWVTGGACAAEGVVCGKGTWLLLR